VSQLLAARAGDERDEDISDDRMDGCSQSQKKSNTCARETNFGGTWLMSLLTKHVLYVTMCYYTQYY
jgi:hypothetical protein